MSKIACLYLYFLEGADSHRVVFIIGAYLSLSVFEDKNEIRHAEIEDWGKNNRKVYPIVKVPIGREQRGKKRNI